jgi:SEC-C motif
MKVGRNDLCPCGNGKKFKKCHLIMPPLIPQPDPSGLVIPDHIWRKFEEHHRKEQARAASFGKIRPMIQWADYHGYRLVVVRNRVYYSKKWKFFADFLTSYVALRFGKDWLDAQNSATPAEQHPLYIWRKQAYEFIRRLLPQPDGTFAGVPNSPTLACHNFYYDLYTVDDNTILDENLLARLKDRNQFQGALHELFVEATCLRAGFTIIRENEKD